MVVCGAVRGIMRNDQVALKLRCAELKGVAEGETGERTTVDRRQLSTVAPTSFPAAAESDPLRVDPSCDVFAAGREQEEEDYDELW